MGQDSNFSCLILRFREAQQVYRRSLKTSISTKSLKKPFFKVKKIFLATAAPVGAVGKYFLQNSIIFSRKNYNFTKNTEFFARTN